MNEKITEGQGETTPRVEVDALDVRLPCRAFRVSYKVAEQGKLSLTTEFVLRLLRSADELKEDSIGLFFGFTSDEVRFAIDQAERFDYVERINGRVHLTEAGRNLFTVGGDEPALFQVVSKHERVNVDLISFAPVDSSRRLSDFEFALPELQIRSISDVGTASEHVRQSFAKHFSLFRPKRGTVTSSGANSLYTVDSVQPDKRFSTLVPIDVSVRPDSPTTPEADLLSWKSGVDLDERAGVLQACGNLVRGISATSQSRSDEAARELLRCAPDVVGRFERDGTVDWGSYFRSTIRQAGRLQADRPTVRVVGRAWVEANKERLARAAEYSVRRGGARPPMIIWVKPDVPQWGMTTRLPDLVDGLRHAFQGNELANEDGLRVVLAGQNPPEIFQHAFDATLRLPTRVLSPDIEILLVPGRLAMLLAHSPVGAVEGFPVPMGIITFDPTVVRRTHGAVTALLSAVGIAPGHCNWETKDLLGEVEDALGCLPGDGVASDGDDRGSE